MFFSSYVQRMSVLRSADLAPPRDLATQTDSVVIVSSKRPVAVYYDRTIELVMAKVVAGGKGSNFDITITGAGGAISRCEQVARYTVQALKSQYKHLVKSVEKKKEISETIATDLKFPDSMGDEEDLLSLDSVKRPIRTVSISIQVFLV